MINTAELKRIADGLHTIGKPGSDTIRTARVRVELMGRFTVLVTAATPSERRDLVATLKEMLEG